jgi:hypothetical protein
LQTNLESEALVSQRAWETNDLSFSTAIVEWPLGRGEGTACSGSDLHDSGALRGLGISGRLGRSGGELPFISNSGNHF